MTLIDMPGVKHGGSQLTEEVDLHLFHTPGACSRVILNAIEEIGTPYRETALSLGRGDQRSPDYLALNPKGKVPLLIDRGVEITESPAILYHLAIRFPSANLLPTGAEGRPTLAALSDLIWMSGALHPAMNKAVLPQMTSQVDVDGIRNLGLSQLTKLAELLSTRYETPPWYYGNSWSIMDYFVTWGFSPDSGRRIPTRKLPKACRFKRTLRKPPIIPKGAGR